MNIYDPTTWEWLPFNQHPSVPCEVLVEHPKLYDENRKYSYSGRCPRQAVYQAHQDVFKEGNKSSGRELTERHKLTLWLCQEHYNELVDLTTIERRKVLDDFADAEAKLINIVHYLEDSHV